jgi:hypothetical protein
MRQRPLFLPTLLFSFAFSLLFTFNLHSQEYYPLQIGNRWDYIGYWLTYSPLHSDIDSFSVIVTKDTMLFGKKYFILNRYDLAGGNILRIESDEVLYLRSFDSPDECSIFRFNAKIGEGWQNKTSLMGAIYITLGHLDTADLFGFKTQIQSYGLTGLFDRTVMISDKFGLIKFQSYGEPPGFGDGSTELYGCIIGGKTYGKLLDVKKNNVQPNSFILYQNYPNPFNPKTNIKFYIPRTSFVSLKIFDILGCEVETLLNELKPAGDYSVLWDARPKPSGVYFYRLFIKSASVRSLNSANNSESSDFILTKKLIISK